jgi:hypothetical protein
VENQEEQGRAEEEIRFFSSAEPHMRLPLFDAGSAAFPTTPVSDNIIRSKIEAGDVCLLQDAKRREGFERSQRAR